MKRTIYVIALAAALVLSGFALQPVGSMAARESSNNQIILAQSSQSSTSSQSSSAQSAQAPAPQRNVPSKVEANRGLTITMFLVIIGITLGIVVWAARRTRTTSDFFAARSSITGWQNGWAIAGDWMSAATFLGVAGLISLFGFEGLYWAVGAIMAFVTVLLLVAEPCRNLGKYTIGDILSFRASAVPVRACIAVVTVILSVMYLILQMVGAGKLMMLLLGVPFKLSIVGVGILMICYVIFGGMIATTWVQIVKAVLLMCGGIVLFVLVGAHVGFNPLRLFSEIAGSKAIQDWVQTVLLKDAIPKAGFDYGQRFLEPGLFIKSPWDQLGNCIGFLLGTAGMPHVLMRFFTVPDAVQARKSAVIAMFLIGGFMIMTAFSGFGAALFVSPQAVFSVDRGGNMANLLLSQLLGTEIAPWFGALLTAFLCAVAFATILAVVSGVVLAGAGAIAHDVYVNIIKRNEQVDERRQMLAARTTSIAVGVAGILIGLAAENQNVAQIGVIAFGVAASGNFPAIMLSLFWRKMTTAGICAALLAGTISSVGLVLVSPSMTYPKLVAANAQKLVTELENKQATGAALSEKEAATLQKAKQTYEANKDGTSMLGLDKPLFPLKNPGLVSVPIGFLAAIIFSLLFPSKREQDAFDQLYVRQMTGIGVAKAVQH